MATRKKRGGRPSRTGKVPPARKKVVAPSGVYRMTISDEVLKFASTTEIDACFKRALLDMSRHFQKVNNGTAVVTSCKSRSGRTYFILIDLRDHGHPDGGLEVHVGTPSEFGQGN